MTHHYQLYRYALGALYPAFSGVTVGGAMGTGAHGSSLTFPSALGAVVTNVTILDGNAVLRTVVVPTNVHDESSHTAAGRVAGEDTFLFSVTDPVSTPVSSSAPPPAAPFTPLLLQAVQAHLGVLGVLLQVTLKIVPQFKVRVDQTVLPEAYMLNGSFLADCSTHLWIYAGWYPHLKKVVLRTSDSIDDSSTSFFLLTR